ncbi:hypothetical protein ABT133_34820, partial [Streptomyces sp. NPDC001835]|uniref:hypothetical protein n=1 Tax=Streptomyces sp. NPDC001835 TaxID=3154528 RepID=UPI0033239B84
MERFAIPVSAGVHSDERVGGVLVRGLPESRIGTGGILGITSLAGADDWNSVSGPWAVTVSDLERPEWNNLSRGAFGWCTTVLQTTLGTPAGRSVVPGPYRVRSPGRIACARLVVSRRQPLVCLPRVLGAVLYAAGRGVWSVQRPGVIGGGRTGVWSVARG